MSRARGADDVVTISGRVLPLILVLVSGGCGLFEILPEIEEVVPEDLPPPNYFTPYAPEAVLRRRRPGRAPPTAGFPSTSSTATRT